MPGTTSTPGAPDKMPDLPPAPYRSADRATIERHVREAREAGIDALVLSWLGPGNPTEDNFRTLLDVAQAQGLRATVDVECTSPFMPDLGRALGGAGAPGRRSTPRTRPFCATASRPGGLFLAAAALLARASGPRCAPRSTPSAACSGSPRATIRPGWSVFDGLHMYSVTWPVNTNPEYTASKMRARVDAYNAEHGTSKAVGRHGHARL